MYSHFIPISKTKGNKFNSMILIRQAVGGPVFRHQVHETYHHKVVNLEAAPSPFYWLKQKTKHH